MPVAVQVVSSHGLCWSKHENKVKASCGMSSTVGNPTEDAQLFDSTSTVLGSGDPVAATAPESPTRALPVAIA